MDIDVDSWIEIRKCQIHFKMKSLKSSGMLHEAELFNSIGKLEMLDEIATLLSVSTESVTSYIGNLPASEQRNVAIEQDKDEQ